MSDAAVILAPVDFSTHSRAAALRACDLAKVSGARVHLLHALDLPAVAKRNGIAPGLFDELRRSERQKFEELERDLAPHGVPVETTLEECEPVELILEHARRDRADLIVMGTHGYRGLDRLFLGSVAERTLRAATIPVMTVKENEWDAAAKIRRILLATDFSADAERAVRLAMHWARYLGADVEVFHAIQPDPSGAAGDLRDAALAGLQAILGRMIEAGIPATADLTHGPPAIEIAKRALESRANLVVMGRRGQSRRERAPCGGVTERVLRQVKCSVLMAPSPDGEIPPR